MTQIKTFKTGDVVQLKSGGPKMTVDDYEPQYNRVVCQWFAGSKLERGYFPLDSVDVQSEQPK